MRSIDTSTLSRLVGDIYDASAHPERWPAVLGVVAEAFGAKSGVLRMLGMGPSREVRATYHHNLHDELKPLATVGWRSQTLTWTF